MSESVPPERLEAEAVNYETMAVLSAEEHVQNMRFAKRLRSLLAEAREELAKKDEK